MSDEQMLNERAEEAGEFAMQFNDTFTTAFEEFCPDGACTKMAGSAAAGVFGSSVNQVMNDESTFKVMQAAASDAANVMGPDFDVSTLQFFANAKSSEDISKAAAGVLNALQEDPETMWLANFFGGFSSGMKNEG